MGGNVDLVNSVDILIERDERFQKSEGESKWLAQMSKEAGSFVDLPGTANRKEQK